MSEQVDLIWYEKPTFSETEQRVHSDIKQSPKADQQKPQKTSAAQPKVAKPATAKSAG